MAAETSPPVSPISPVTKGRKTPPLTLDLSDLPPLITPSPPSNTLIITGLEDPQIFHPANLITLRDGINDLAPLYTWSPLKSFRRIIATFFDTSAAILIKQKLDGESILSCRTRVYFGTNTPINPDPAATHLQAPKSDKLFFISPPPSPPAGWESRNEEPPNKEVHAEDLASALSRLHARTTEMPSPTTEEGNPETSPERRRSRSGSTTIVYHPAEHGDSPDLPAIAVEDMTGEPEEVEDLSPMEDIERKLVHTARPPVELMMHDA